MRLNFRSTVHTQSLGSIPVKKSAEQVACCWRYDLRSWEVKRLCQNLPVHIVSVLVVEWWQSRKHLVKEDTECPPVDGLGVASTV